LQGLSGGSGSAGGGPYTRAALKAYLDKMEAAKQPKERPYVIVEGKVVYVDNYSNE
jgi:hypothetical protein